MEYQDPEKRAMAPAEPLSEPHAGQADCKSIYRRRSGRYFDLTIGLLVTLGLYLLLSHKTEPLLESVARFPMSSYQKQDQCPQVAPLVPRLHTPKLDRMDQGLMTEAFMNASIARLSSVVQIPTESFDDMGPVDEDTRWRIFFDFAEHLRSLFPLIHSELKLEMVNTHGLLYTWEGEEVDKKPLLLMAHQDVVPVPKATVSSWTYPPFSGYYDGKYIWGRGSSDCKNQLIAVMESIEELLGAGFKPKRTVVLSFGFDEEVSGPEGAGHLAPFLLSRYGHNGIAAIVDEGAGVSIPDLMMMCLLLVATVLLNYKANVPLKW